MTRVFDYIIGIEQPWQFYRAAVYLADGRRMGVRCPAPFPPETATPALKRLMWRACVKALRDARP